MSTLLRMADANANRAAEALRTLEDLDRFRAAGGSVAPELRGIRHELRAVVAVLDPAARTAARDAAGDPGAPDHRASMPSAIGADAPRRGAVDIAAAAGSRLGEALRALEESLRVLRPDLAPAIERLRFRGYDASAAVLRSLGTGRARQWRLCLLLTEEQCRRPWREVLRAALEAGVDCLQVREKGMDGAALLERTRAVLEAARPRGASVFVNDRADVALAAGADGVHLGRDDLPIRAARALGGGLLVGASTHDLDEARAAIAEGADVCGVGAMYATATKPQRRPSGPGFLRAFVAAFPAVPHLAIGGVTPERMPELVAAGARGVAVGSAVCAADDPGAVAASILEAIAAAPPLACGSAP